jgi:hypothetical protein
MGVRMTVQMLAEITRAICHNITKPYILHCDLHARVITFLNSTYSLVFITNTQSVQCEMKFYMFN